MRGIIKTLNKTYMLIFIFTFFIISVSFAQEITFDIVGAKDRAVLFGLEGEKISKIDSFVSVKGDFQFNLNNMHNGFFRLQFDSKHWIDFINDGKNVKIKTDYSNLFDSLEVIESESNKLLYEFIKQNKEYKTKTELLNIILAHYPKDDEYYETTKNKLLRIQNKYHHFVKETSQVKTNSFIARYIQSAQLPIIDISIQNQEHLVYLKNHALDNIDFNDEEMIYSDLYTSKSIEYLTYYRNQQLQKSLLEQEFMKAVDTLLNRAKVNELVYQHVAEYLIDGFTKFGFDNIIDYIVSNYVLADELCLNEKTGNSIQNRVNQAKILKVGETVPNIIIPDISGKNIDLSELQSEKVLILFYASWCTHCQTMIPKIRDIYKNLNMGELEVLAISLDTNKEEWLNFLKENTLDWLNVSDFNGWDGQAAESYFIYATPTMFLVNKDKKIIAKPLSIEILNQYL